jgi:hypothetical protein
MKNKLFLLIIVGMFLISIGSVSSLGTIVLKPLDAPTGMTLTNTTGTIPAGNYSIAIVHVGNMSGYTSTPRLESPPVIMNITLNETGGIQVNWTNSTNPWLGGTMVFIKNVTAPTYSWYHVRSTGYVVNQKKGEGYVIGNVTTDNYAPEIWMTDSNTPNPSMPFGLNSTGGIGLVYITGTSGTIYMSDIVNAINASYGGTLPNTIAWDGFNRFYGAWTIAVLNSTTAGIFDVSGNTIWLWGGYSNPGYPLQIKASWVGEQPTVLQFPPYQGSGSFTYWGNASLNNTIIGSGARGLDSSYTGSMQMTSYSNTYIWNSVVLVSYPILAYKDLFYKSKLGVGEAGIYYYGGKDLPIYDLTLIYGSLRWGESWSGNDTYIIRYENQQTCASSYHINMRFFSKITSALYLVDSSFPQCSGNIPLVYWYLTTNSPTGLYLGNSVNIKVIDNNGNAINNSNITIIDKNSNIIFTKITNSSGTIPVQYVFHHVLNRTTMSYGYTDTVIEFAPFNVSIVTDGYKTYEMNNLNFSTAQDWTVTLESQPDWNYSNELLFECVNNTGIGVCAIDQDGNMKIAGQLHENTNSSYIDSIPESERFLSFSDKFVLTVSGDLYLIAQFIEEVI